MSTLQSLSHISLDVEPVPWDTDAPTAWSLLDVLKAYAYIYTVIDSQLALVAGEVGHIYATPETAKEGCEAMAKIFRSILGEIEDKPELIRTTGFVRLLLSRLGPPYGSFNVAAEIETLRVMLNADLSRMNFLYLKPASAFLYEKPLAGFVATLESFPSTREHIEAASRCRALGFYTASVYHCMAIAQTGLLALADDLGVAFSYSLELAEWQSIIQAIETKIEPMRHLPRTERDKCLPFYSSCALQFRYFKDVWRNHVAHMRMSYDEHESQTVYIHVRQFMETLAKRISETPPS